MKQNLSYDEAFNTEYTIKHIKLTLHISLTIAFSVSLRSCSYSTLLTIYSFLNIQDLDLLKKKSKFHMEKKSLLVMNKNHQGAPLCKKKKKKP